jgi:hypothetical protein
MRIAAIDRNRSSVGIEQTIDAPEQRRLARPAFSHKRNAFSRRYRESHFVERHNFSVTL